MINVVIGQAGSGKTHFAIMQWGKGMDLVETGAFWTGEALFFPKEKLSDLSLVPYTLINDVAFIGDYVTEDRTKGTDTLPYNALPKILHTIDILYPLHDIVVEGDRINNERFFDHLLRNRYRVKLYHLRCPIETSVDRLKSAGSTIGLSFIKGTRTKSKRMFEKYGPRMNGEAIGRE